MDSASQELETLRRRKNLRTGWIVGSIALAFFLGFLLRQFLGR